MAYVITKKCLNEQYAQCVDVCPVDCIYPGNYEKKPFMVIDPKRCINCDACLVMCPINAIVSSEDQDPEATKLNKELAPKFYGNPSIIPRSPKSPPREQGNSLTF